MQCPGEMVLMPVSYPSDLTIVKGGRGEANRIVHNMSGGVV